jgi:phosphoglycerate dehydrogenase-like enzyme
VVKVLITDSSDAAGVELLHSRGAEVIEAPDGDPETIRQLARDAEAARSVAEYCAMAMLVLARNPFPISLALKSRSWDEARALGAAQREIAGLTAGIVGVGEIGKRLARICRQGFGMRVLGFQRRIHLGERPRHLLNPEAWDRFAERIPA